MKLKPGLGASYTIRPGNGSGSILQPWTHTRLRLVGNMVTVVDGIPSIKLDLQKYGLCADF